MIQSNANLRDYLAVVRRRWLLVIPPILLVPLVAVAISLRATTRYSASAEVLLNQQSLAAGITGLQIQSGSSPDRVAQTQADVAAVPTVAARVLRALRLHDRAPAMLLAASSVVAKADADLLVFSVTDPSPRMAERLATEYAHQFTVYRRHLDTVAIRNAKRGIDARLADLRRAHDTRSALYQSLVERDQELDTMAALETGYFMIRGADGAVAIGPRPVRAGVLGLVLGLALGLGLAYLREALDTRVRTAEGVSEHLHVPLLARLPAPSRRLVEDEELAMVREPAGRHAEPFRMLRTNLEFARLDRSIRTVMVTSAVEREGKSTTVANLAVALARSGQRVVLVDLDLRRPFLERYFHLRGRVGLTDVVLGHRRLEEALVRIPLFEPSSARRVTTGRENGAVATGKNGNGSGDRTRIDGWLEVLPCGTIPPDPGEFVGKQVVHSVLDGLASRADLVLLDTPPLLHVGDALTLSRAVDGIVVVCRANVVRRPMLAEVRRLLASTTATVLGFVLTGAVEGGDYGYGYSGPQERGSQARDAAVRAER